jgi:hypothetical protein
MIIIIKKYNIIILGGCMAGKKHRPAKSKGAEARWESNHSENEIKRERKAEARWERGAEGHEPPQSEGAEARWEREKEEKPD